MNKFTKSGFINDDGNIINSIWGYWSDRVELEEGVTLNDLLIWVRALSASDLLILSGLCDSNIGAFLLHEDDEVPDYTLISINISKVLELSNFEGSWEMSDYLHVNARSDSDSYGIEFTSWNALKHCFLKLENPCQFRTTTYEECEPYKSFPFMEYTLTRKRASEETKDVVVWYTVGDFLSGLFGELCFFSTPAEAQKRFEEILSRAEDIKAKCEDLN